MRILLVLCLVFSACASNQAEPTAAAKFYTPEQLGDFIGESTQKQSNDYIISIGDELDVVFLYHTDLSTPELIVRSDGRISLPYVGDVMAAGYRPMQLDSVLTKHFSEILRDPNLSVIVRKSAGKMVFVLGEVEHGGGYPFDIQVSLLQALALAGGVKKSGKADHAVVIRREGVSRIIGVEVDVNAITRGEAIHQDFLLRNNDIIYIPKNRLSSVRDFMEAVNIIVSPPITLYLRGWEVANVDAVYEFYRNRAD
ncbi:MAG: polysaccharide biosynthesis/export family protein [Candidatus Latescibacterota bacterium]